MAQSSTRSTLPAPSGQVRLFPFLKSTYVGFFPLKRDGDDRIFLTIEYTYVEISFYRVAYPFLLNHLHLHNLLLYP